MSKGRPSSAQSRQAWGDYGHARPDSQFDFGQDGIRDDPDLSPTAMEDDYMHDSKGKSNAVATNSNKQSKSFLSKIGSGVRSLWATRQTEDVKGDRELHVKTTLRELIVYLVFLVILCVVTFGMTTTTMYYYTKVMSDLFLDTTHSGGGTFRTITSVEDFWKFAKGPLVKGLYWETWYNNQSVPTDQLGYIYYENKLLGVPRIRQLQVHSNSCVVHDDFKNVIRECFEAYAESLENKNPFGEQDNHTGWFYQSEDALDGSSHWGLLTTYSGAGYVEDLTQNKTESEATINYLFDKRWIVRGTRVVFIDFTVYNANINLFCVVRLTVEFPPTGGAIPHATLRTVKLIRYVTVTDYFIMACEFIFCLFIVYYMIEEAIEIKKHKCSYFKSFWNILDILVISIAIVCVAFNVYRTLKVEELLSDLLKKPDQYADFEFLSYGQTQFDNAIAIAVFLAWIKIFKYISFNKTMTQLSSTLGKCAKDLAGFAVMFFIIFLAFTQLGYLLFGTQVKDFSNFQNSFFTLFRIILGDFDFEQLEQANRVLGPIFFMLFVFFVFFVLINMFLAIINDTYSEVKGDMANQKNEFEMTDYFKRGYEKVISKLNFKHDKIVDIQKALQSADINNDKQLDFDEWRTDLKMRGYADGEIEALFARYDVDGDRVLDEEEQSKMQADLAKQKMALNKEYDELEKIQRPESARRSNSKLSFNDDSAEESDDEDSHTKSSRSGPSQSVSYEEFTVLSRRVDRMEHSIGSIVSKIDAVLVKLEAMEKAKLKRRETMGKILDSITESDGTSDEVKREQMERLVREELERWDSESSITPQPSGRGASPSSSGRGGARSRSRPGSGGNAWSIESQISDDEKSDSEKQRSSIWRSKATIKVHSAARPKKAPKQSKKKKLEIEVDDSLDSDSDWSGALSTAHSETELLDTHVAVINEKSVTSEGFKSCSVNSIHRSLIEDGGLVSVTNGYRHKKVDHLLDYSKENSLETVPSRHFPIANSKDSLLDYGKENSLETVPSRHFPIANSKDSLLDYGKENSLETVPSRHFPIANSKDSDERAPKGALSSETLLYAYKDKKQAITHDSPSFLPVVKAEGNNQDITLHTSKNEARDIMNSVGNSSSPNETKLQVSPFEKGFNNQNVDRNIIFDRGESVDESRADGPLNKRNSSIKQEHENNADPVPVATATLIKEKHSEFLNKRTSLSSEFDCSFTDNDSVDLSEFLPSETEDKIDPSDEVSPPLITFKGNFKNTPIDSPKSNQTGNVPGISSSSTMVSFKPVETPNEHEQKYKAKPEPDEKSLKYEQCTKGNAISESGLTKSIGVEVSGRSGVEEEFSSENQQIAVFTTAKGQHVSVGSLSKQIKAREAKLEQQNTSRHGVVTGNKQAESDSKHKSKTISEKSIANQEPTVVHVGKRKHPKAKNSYAKTDVNNTNQHLDVPKSVFNDKLLKTSKEDLTVKDSLNRPTPVVPPKPTSNPTTSSEDVAPKLPPRAPKVQEQPAVKTIPPKDQVIPEQELSKSKSDNKNMNNPKVQNTLKQNSDLKLKKSDPECNFKITDTKDSSSMKLKVTPDCQSILDTKTHNATYQVDPVSLNSKDSVKIEMRNPVGMQDSIDVGSMTKRHDVPLASGQREMDAVCYEDKSTGRAQVALPSGLEHNVSTQPSFETPVIERTSTAVFV